MALVAAYVVLAVLLACKLPTIVEGFFLSPGFLGVCVAVPVAALSLVYLITRGALRVGGTGKLWSRSTAVVLLLVLWAVPFVPGYLPRLAGYWLRVKALADVPAILDWADGYATSTTRPATGPATGPWWEWEDIPPDALPPAVKAMGGAASFRRRDRAVMIANGGALAGHWGLTVGRGVASTPEARWGWRVNDDAFVWDSE